MGTLRWTSHELRSFCSFQILCQFRCQILLVQLFLWKDQLDFTQFQYHRAQHPRRLHPSLHHFNRRRKEGQRVDTKLVCRKQHLFLQLEYKYTTWMDPELTHLDIRHCTDKLQDCHRNVLRWLMFCRHTLRYIYLQFHTLLDPMDKGISQSIKLLSK